MNETLNLTNHWVGYWALGIFFLAYVLVIVEEKTHLRKSKPVLIAAGLIWIPIGIVYAQNGIDNVVGEAIKHNLLENALIFFFLLSAMTYINTMDERNVFEALRSWLVRRGWGKKTMFWATGLLAFFISPVIDNLTTALIMGAVVLAIGAGDTKFVAVSCISIVVAANAGGAFSPFGDITTLLVWQKGILSFWEFFALFIPSLANWFIPAFCMSFVIPNTKLPMIEEVQVKMRRGGGVVILLFLFTIVMTIILHNYLHIPSAFGMMLGLGFLKVYSWFLKKSNESSFLRNFNNEIEDAGPFDIMKKIGRSEWDTLFFFYGVILCVGGLGFIGHLGFISEFAYGVYGPTFANIGVGVVSAVLDNIPVMLAVLSMDLTMSDGQWLLVTLTAGVGGSLLSIGSAAGVALMGQSKGMYTFFSHLKWTPFIFLGYVAAIWIHMWMNASTF